MRAFTVHDDDDFDLAAEMAGISLDGKFRPVGHEDRSASGLAAPALPLAAEVVTGADGMGDIDNVLALPPAVPRFWNFGGFSAAVVDPLFPETDIDGLLAGMGSSMTPNPFGSASPDPFDAPATMPPAPGGFAASFAEQVSPPRGGPAELSGLLPRAAVRPPLAAPLFPSAAEVVTGQDGMGDIDNVLSLPPAVPRFWNFGGFSAAVAAGLPLPAATSLAATSLAATSLAAPLFPAASGRFAAQLSPPRGEPSALSGLRRAAATKKASPPRGGPEEPNETNVGGLHGKRVRGGNSAMVK